MKLFYFFIIGFFTFILNGCFLPINCKKCFTTYKQPITEDSIRFQLRYDGVYLPTDKSINEGFVFYKNGITKWLVTGDIAFYKDSIKNGYMKRGLLYSINYWGHFNINRDTIIIQVFNWNSQEQCRRWIHELKGKIINDSTIIINTWYSNRSGIFSPPEYLLISPFYLHFYQTSLKPDYKNAWFYKKNWYKKNLHESRK